MGRPLLCAAELQAGVNSDIEAGNPDPDRTLETKRAYAIRAQALIDRFVRESPGEPRDWRDDPMAFCSWFSELRLRLAPASWRQYRAAMVFFMENNGPVECVDYLRTLPAAPPRRLGRGAKRAGKAKRLGAEELRAILDALSPERQRWDRLLGLWLVAGVLTGLRPCEWRHARMDADVLIVRNAKATHGRAPGIVRRIDLSVLSDFERESVRAMLEAIGAEPDFSRAYNAVRQRLLRLTKRLWPRRRLRPSLYSARHQFRADAASVGRTAIEQAALMGHISIRTAESHYGRRRHGNGQARIGADPECIAKIERYEREYQQANLANERRKRTDRPIQPLGDLERK